MEPQEFENKELNRSQDNLDVLSELADRNLFDASELANQGENHPNGDFPNDNAILYQDSQQQL